MESEEHRIMPLVHFTQNPYNIQQEKLAKVLFEQSHWVWSQEEVDKHWLDPLYVAEINQYRLLAQTAIDYLWSVIKIP
jgi:hypothetical protein